MSWLRRFVGKNNDADEPANVPQEVRELLDPYQERSLIVEGGKAVMNPGQVLDNIRRPP